MRIAALTCVCVLLAGSRAPAQETPKVEWGFSYTHVWIGSTSNITIADPRPQPAGPAQRISFAVPSFSANGASTHVAFNVMDRLAAVAEFAGFSSIMRTVALRPIQLDYLYMHPRSPGDSRFTDFNQNCIRYQAGLVLRFGGERAPAAGP